MLSVIFFLQTFNFCYSQLMGGGILPLFSVSTKADNILEATMFSVPSTTISVINGINIYHRKPASDNAPFGIILGAFQIYATAQFSSNSTVRTINYVSGSCLILTSVLRMYDFEKDSKTAFNFNIMPMNNGSLLVGFNFSHQFN